MVLLASNLPGTGKASLRVMALAEAQGINLSEYARGLNTDTSKTDRQKLAILTEELLAHIEEGRAKGKLRAYLEAVVGAIRAFFRKHGFAQFAEMGITDIQHLLRQAREYGEQVEMAGEVPAFMVAWHGSPYEFDAFSLEHMGKGEGAQAYGWGLYFAGKREVADWYRRNLSDDAEYSIIQGGKPWDFSDTSAEWDNDWRIPSDTDEYLVLQSLSRTGDVEATRSELGGNEAALAFLIEMENKGLSFGQGHLYKVDIPEDGEYLLWDKPLSEQPEAVRDAVRGAYIKAFYSADQERLEALPETDERKSTIVRLKKQIDKIDLDDVYDVSGRGLYAGLTDRLGSDEAASKFLNEIGIPGIKYLDGTSRGAGDGSFNYVIFDDAAIKILEREQGPAFSLAPETKASYEARIDELFSGGPAKTGTRILDSSDVMGLLKHQRLPLVLNERHLKDGMTSHPEMTAGVWKKVPGWVENPAAAYRSADPKFPHRVVILGPERVGGYPLVLVIDPKPGKVGGRKGAQEVEHLLVTAFAKTTGAVPLAEAARNGKLLFLSNEKALVAGQGGGVQFPKHADLQQGRSKILTDRHLAAYRRSDTAGRADSPASDGLPPFSLRDSETDALVAQYANVDGAPSEAEIREARKQYRETERAYGGREAYEKAKADGRTKLNYSQWVTVRTPNFKRWFGDWESEPANASKVTDPTTGEPMVVRGLWDFTDLQKGKGFATSMPEELRQELASWGYVSQSPFSDSFYDMPGKDWESTPEGIQRISDHWNFASRGQKHMTTDAPVKNNTHWTLARYEGGTWKVVKSFPKDNARADQAFSGLEQIRSLERAAIAQGRKNAAERGTVKLTPSEQQAIEDAKTFFLNDRTGQIKSATGNVGTFGEASDIRFKVGGHTPSLFLQDARYRSNGQPWSSRRQAQDALTARGLEKTHRVMKDGNGYVLAKAPVPPAETILRKAQRKWPAGRAGLPCIDKRYTISAWPYSPSSARTQSLFSGGPGYPVLWRLSPWRAESWCN